MIEIVVLFIGVVGSLGAPGVPERTASAEEDAESILSSLPGLENLNEKAMPLSKLILQPPFAPGAHNLVEKTHVSSQLPGTKNLAEKRIPEAVLLKLSQMPEVDQ